MPIIVFVIYKIRILRKSKPFEHVDRIKPMVVCKVGITPTPLTHPTHTIYQTVTKGVC